MGIPYWIPGGFAGSGEPQILLDENGEYMHTGRLYHPEDRKHMSARGPKSGPKGRAYSAFPLDWDEDGDIDLIVGNDQGGIFLRENRGTAKSFAFSSEAVAVTIHEEPAVVPGGYAMPIVADWDGDGRWDLVSGNKKGEVWWFRNTGEAGAPVLEEPRRLVGNSKDEGLGRGGSAQVEVCDWDGDGDLDLLVGDAHLTVVDDELDAHGYVWLFRRKSEARPAEAASGRGSQTGDAGGF